MRDVAVGKYVRLWNDTSAAAGTHLAVTVSSAALRVCARGRVCWLLAVCFCFCSQRSKAWQECAAAGEWDSRIMPQIQGDLSQSTHSSGVGGPPQDLWYVLHRCVYLTEPWGYTINGHNLDWWDSKRYNRKRCLKLTPSKYCIWIHLSLSCRWHPWSILWPTEALWIWGFPSREQLPVSGRLRGQREAVSGNHLSSAGLQNQVPRELLPPERKPWVCFNQQNIWLLWWVWVIVMMSFAVVSWEKWLCWISCVAEL